MLLRAHLTSLRWGYMVKQRSLEENYRACEEEGMFEVLEEADKDIIKTLRDTALSNLEFVQNAMQYVPKESKQWNAVYIMHYMVLHELTEAFLLFDKVKISNHKCLFAYQCRNHQELDLDWNFFERIRTKRNRSIYYGTSISYSDWKEIEVQMGVYIETLEHAIDQRLNAP